MYAPQEDQKELAISQEGVLYYDTPNKRAASNVTVKTVGSQLPDMKVYQIFDFSKVSYTEL